MLFVFIFRLKMDILYLVIMFFFAGSLGFETDLIPARSILSNENSYKEAAWRHINGPRQSCKARFGWGITYSTGWYLYGSDWGCCGNYNGCCLFASAACYLHDRICKCCQYGKLMCGPFCRKDPDCRVGTLFRIHEPTRMLH